MPVLFHHLRHINLRPVPLTMSRITSPKSRALLPLQPGHQENPKENTHLVTQHWPDNRFVSLLSFNVVHNNLLVQFTHLLLKVAWSQMKKQMESVGVHLLPLRSIDGILVEVKISNTNRMTTTTKRT